MSRKSEQHDVIVQKLEADHLELRAELDTLKNEDDSDQKKLLEELVKLQNIYDHEKEESKALEKNIAQFREEVLELKKEKHKLSDILKLKEQECETLNTKFEALNVTNPALGNVSRTKVKV
jgi:predicted nuclease with TOPRIM domain